MLAGGAESAAPKRPADFPSHRAAQRSLFQRRISTGSAGFVPGCRSAERNDLAVLCADQEHVRALFRADIAGARASRSRGDLRGAERAQTGLGSLGRIAADFIAHAAHQTAVRSAGLT